MSDGQFQNVSKEFSLTIFFFANYSKHLLIAQKIQKEKKIMIKITFIAK